MQCCPKIKKSDFNNKEHNWDNKVFYTGDFLQIFYEPVGMMSKINNIKQEIIEMHKLEEPYMVLHKDVHPFKGKVLLNIERPKDIDENVELISGKFYSVMYEGEYELLNKEVRKMKEYIKEKYGLVPKEIYYWYVNCADCASADVKKTVIFARVI